MDGRTGGWMSEMDGWLDDWLANFRVLGIDGWMDTVGSTDAQMDNGWTDG